MKLDHSTACVGLIMRAVTFVSEEVTNQGMIGPRFDELNTQQLEIWNNNGNYRAYHCHMVDS